MKRNPRYVGGNFSGSGSGTPLCSFWRFGGGANPPGTTARLETSTYNATLLGEFSQGLELKSRNPYTGYDDDER